MYAQEMGSYGSKVFGHTTYNITLFNYQYNTNNVFDELNRF